jgi:hypothetical protein
MKLLLFLFNLIILQSRYRSNDYDEEAVGLAIGIMIVYFVFILAFIILMVISMWKIFEKAGKPGWAAIVPIYNVIILLEIVGRPLWWIILLIIPCVNIVINIIVCIDLAKSFGKDAGYGIGLALLSIIFFPILGFGKAQYMGPSVAPPASMNQPPYQPPPPPQG